MTRSALAMVLLLAVSACTSARARVERGLTRAGVPTPVASCMAAEMADRLSLAQLRRLGDLRRLDQDIAGGLTLERFLDDVRALRDPEIVAVTSLAGGVCWALNRPARPPASRPPGTT